VLVGPALEDGEADGADGDAVGEGAGADGDAVGDPLGVVVGAVDPLVDVVGLALSDGDGEADSSGSLSGP
jgi:hypothetical protein